MTEEFNDKHVVVTGSVVCDALADQATHDELTSLPNRRELLARLNSELARAVRYERPLAIVMADIDHFKRVNDTYGHQVGDEVLQSVAEMLGETLRPMDTVARYGGEEFVMLLPETDLEGAVTIAARIREHIAGHAIEAAGGLQIEITVSFGAATLSSVANTAELLIRHADDALYTSKRMGRNRVTASGTFRLPQTSSPNYN